jgi:two-component system, sensor histidine kinase
MDRKKPRHAVMTTEVRVDSEYRVWILPPTRRDGVATCDVLRRAHISCEVSRDPLQLADRIRAGVGAFVITDALAADPRLVHLTAALQAQPTWSDTPAILLSRADEHSVGLKTLLSSTTNVTILDRPTSMRTLASSVRAALRERRRQYQIRDQLTQLRDAQEALRGADRRKDEFLAMLAHELRNPLAPISTANELLARTVAREGPPKAAVEIVRRQVTHLTRMVDDLLDVSRVTQGRIQLQKKPIEVASIISEALEGAEPLLKEKQHRVEFAAHPKPLYVDGDNARLVQCVTNLLINASKYTDSGGNIRIETRAADSRVHISVRDNGVGISADLMPRIFDLFVQSSRSLDRAQGGLGIGLSVVQKIVEMHDGKVTACSGGPGQGSTFEILLPQVASPDVIARHVALPERFGAKRILVVDDNMDAATSLAEFLELDGHAVKAVHTAEAAIQDVLSLHFDVVFLDIGLPIVDGYQVARRIREAGLAVRLVALTGYGSGEDIQTARSAGFDAHLVKPASLDGLRMVISGGLQPRGAGN